MRPLTILGFALLLPAISTGSAHAAPPEFEPLDQPARFIPGDNLITDTYPDTTANRARPLTPLRKADGLSAITVTREGRQAISRMTPEDAALLEEAVRALDMLGRGASATPATAPSRPAAGIALSRPASVIGIDNRTQVTTTTVAPYWNIGRLAVGCTGTLITPKHVLTAGHCVSDGAGNWYANLDFTVAQDGSYRPWGSKGWSRVIAPVAWHQNADSNHDYALIVLDAPAHGGHAGWGVYSGGSHTIAGYPGDKPTGTMWRHSGTVTTSGSYRLCYTIDTFGGNSGSGILDTNHYVRGVHTTGSSTRNCGTRLTSTVRNTLQNWITTYPD